MATALKLGKQSFVYRDGWRIDAIGDDDVVWSFIEADAVLEQSDVQSVSEYIEKQYKKEEQVTIGVVPLDKKLRVYNGYDGEYQIDALCSDNEVVCEGVLDGDDNVVGALLFGLSEQGSRVRFIKDRGIINWQRELLSARQQSSNRFIVPGWVHERLGKDKIAGIPVVLGDGHNAVDIMDSLQGKCRVIPYLEWYKREINKTKAKTMSAIALIAVGIVSYAGSFFLDLSTQSMVERAERLNLEAGSLQQQKVDIEKERFFVDWANTPDLVDMLRVSTSSLGDAVRITSMKGEVEYGKRAYLEGIALALKGKLNPKRTKELKIETVMTEGKVGIRFIMERFAHGR